MAKANGTTMTGGSSSAVQYPGTTVQKLIVEVPATHAVRLSPPITATATSALAKLTPQQHRSAGVAVAGAAPAPGAIIAVPVGAGEVSSNMSPPTGQGEGERGFAARRGSGGRRHRPQTSTGSRVACRNIVELSPPGLTPMSTNAYCSPTSQHSSRIRPSTSPRKLAGGGGRGGGSGGGGRGRRGESFAPELVMATVSLCLEGDDDYEATVAAPPNDRHKFTVDTGRFSHFTNQVSPASLLADRAAATASTIGSTSLGGKALVSGSGAVDNGGDYGGRGDGWIRPAETATAGVDKTAAHSHGFRRWRPGESEADRLTGGQGRRIRVVP